MFIQTEETPNPNSLKFFPGEEFNDKGPINFSTEDEASISQLAEALFTVSGVENVFFGLDFVTVTKSKNSQWDGFKSAILLLMMQHFSSKTPTYYEFKHRDVNANQINDSDSEIVKQIKEVLEHRVRPAVAQDGGDIIFHKFEDGILTLELHGACSGCPSSTVTLKNGIESMLRHYVPEVTEVVALNQEL